MAPQPEPFFLDVDATELGRRFAVLYRPQAEVPVGLVVYVHPFAEEMNKSRRMAAMQAREFAKSGFAVLQVDLQGCGDSAGESDDATWAQWVADIVAAAAWLLARYDAPLWLWGLRAGCLLAAEALPKIGSPCHLLFWNPAPAGKVLLQQFLRLKAASHLMDSQAKLLLDELRQAVAAGQSIEVAGYMLSAELANGLATSALAPPGGNVAPARLEWLDLSVRDGATLSPASDRAMAPWQSAGWDVQAQIVQGPSFWQTTEIEDAPRLISATLSVLQARVHR